MSTKVHKPTIEGLYTGNLRMELTHNGSMSKVITDAPLDNNGKGEAFSPTDLVAGALVSCILTVAAIRANENGFNIGHPRFTVDKIMQDSPRKIKRLEVNILFDVQLNELQKRIIERAVKTCPVALSLSAGLIQDVKLTYPN